jgi:hypothetical protein
MVIIMMYGFTFLFRNKDYFVVTEQKNKTNKLAEKVLPLIGCSATDGNIQALLFRLTKAQCEIKTCENSDRKVNKYYEISGENFAGRGSWVDDGATVIINLEVE